MAQAIQPPLPAREPNLDSSALQRDTGYVEDDRPPICPHCGETMVPATLSAEDAPDGEWVCLECEELGQED